MLRTELSPNSRLKKAANGDFATAGAHFPVHIARDGEDSWMPASTRLQLLEPGLVHLPGYADALARGWSPNNVRDVSAEQLDAIRANREAFVADLLSQTGTEAALCHRSCGPIAEASATAARLWKTG